MTTKLTVSFQETIAQFSTGYSGSSFTDDVLHLAVTTVSQLTHTGCKITPSFRDGWSPTMMCFVAQLSFLYNVHSCVQRYTKFEHSQTRLRRRILSEIQCWRARCVRLHLDLSVITAYGPEFWINVPIPDLSTSMLLAIHHVKSLLHGTNRTALRLAATTRHANIERLRQSNKLKALITTLLGTRSPDLDFSTLRLGPTLLTSPSSIHQACILHMHDVSADNTPTFPQLDFTANIDQQFDIFRSFAATTLPGCLHHTIATI